MYGVPVMKKTYNKVLAKDITLDTIIYETALFNPNPTVDSSEAAPIGSDTDCVIDPSSGKYQWASNLWDVMIANDWGPAEVDMTADGSAYKKLTQVKRDGYDLAISALIFNDSTQTRNLAANMIPFMTEGNIILCMTRQAFEEANHTKSYDVMLTDVTPNKERIFKLYLEDKKLRERNEYLEKMYGALAYDKGHGVPVRKLLQAMIANNILEAIMFYSGFIFFWFLGKEMKGTAAMISFIARDERTHVLLFRQILKSTLKAYPNINMAEVEAIAKKMVMEVVQMEIEWLHYITKGEIAAFNDATISRYLHSKGDAIMKGMGFSTIYNSPESPLIAFEKAYDDPNKIKTNFFEGSPKTYSATKLSIDGYLSEAKTDENLKEL